MTTGCGLPNLAGKYFFSQSRGCALTSTVFARTTLFAFFDSNLNLNLSARNQFSFVWWCRSSFCAWTWNVALLLDLGKWWTISHVHHYWLLSSLAHHFVKHRQTCWLKYILASSGFPHFKIFQAETFEVMCTICKVSVCLKSSHWLVTQP
jgi:hypothetical protein